MALYLNMKMIYFNYLIFKASFFEDDGSMVHLQSPQFRVCPSVTVAPFGIVDSDLVNFATNFDNFSLLTDFDLLFIKRVKYNRIIC